jgi:hypothetical protein
MRRHLLADPGYILNPGQERTMSWPSRQLREDDRLMRHRLWSRSESELLLHENQSGQQRHHLSYCFSAICHAILRILTRCRPLRSTGCKDFPLDTRIQDLRDRYCLGFWSHFGFHLQLPRYVGRLQAARSHGAKMTSMTAASIPLHSTK